MYMCVYIYITLFNYYAILQYFLVFIVKKPLRVYVRMCMCLYMYMYLYAGMVCIYAYEHICICMVCM